MASTDLMTYLNYISTWDTESDANIDQLISEQTLFLNLGDFQSDSVIDAEFHTLNNLACEVRDLTIAADATQMASDVAAVGAIFSFGLGSVAFVALQASALIERAVISSKSKTLNEKLTTADADISSQISPNVALYVSKYKENNNLIIGKAPRGLDVSTCRANLMQFMAEVHRKSGKLDAPTFRQYAESARILYSGDEINKVYDALDKLNFSGKSDADVKKFMNVLVGLQIPPNAEYAKTIVTGISVMLMFSKLKIANATIRAQALEAGIAESEVELSAFEAMDAVGKFSAGVVVIMSVIDIVMNVLDIIDVVEQCKKMCDEINGSIKAKYKSYFNGIKIAAQQYKAAITPNRVLDGTYKTSVFYGGRWWDESHPVMIRGNDVTISGVVVNNPQLGTNSLAFSDQINAARGSKPEAGQLSFDGTSCTGWCRFPGEGPIEWRGNVITQ